MGWGTSSELEHYVQEIGQAGQDGLKSKAMLMYKKIDSQKSYERLCSKQRFL